MKDLQPCLEQMRRRGLRVTSVRREILAHVLRLAGHFTAESLLEGLRRGGSTVSRATVYRTLTHFVAAGLLRRYDLGDRTAVYEPIPGRVHHEHLVCDECGAILEFVQDEIERLQDEICRLYRFRARSHTLQIHGVCERCQRQRARRRDPQPATAPRMVGS